MVDPAAVDPPRVGDPAVDDPADVADPPDFVWAVVGAEASDCVVGCRCAVATDLRVGVVFRFVDCARVAGASATASVRAKSVS